MRYACWLAALGIAVALVPQATAREQRVIHHTPVASAPELAALLNRIAVHRDETWRWQRVMLQRPTPFSRSVRRIRSLAYRKWAVRLWHRRASAARRRALNPPHKHQWLCIHHYEGSWTDPSAPYFGGLQMDLAFQTTYGSQLLRRKGTADHWTPLEQMWVAERAYRKRGFWPWPNTARYCGLL